MSRRKDKASLIGSTSGVGLAIARRFIAEGARVAVTGSHAGRIQATRSVLGSAAPVPDA